MSELALPALGARRNLREEITQTLRAAVISGELRPGVVYSAPSLATQFGVSPTPVREAMLDLAGEGLVDTVRNKGFRVTELSEKDLDELSELRALIEVPTVRRIAEAGVPEAVLAELRPLATEIEEAAARGDLIAHVAADMEFHLKLLSLAGNNTWSRQCARCGPGHASTASAPSPTATPWCPRPTNTRNYSTS